MRSGTKLSQFLRGFLPLLHIRAVAFVLCGDHENLSDIHLMLLLYQSSGLPNYFSVVPRRLFCFGSLVILEVVRCYLLLLLLYINIEIGKYRC